MLNEDEIVTRLKNEAGSAIGAHDSLLADDIEKLNDYYHGKPYGNEVEGRSKFVTREVYETVEGIMPYMSKVFFSSDKAVIFDPEDEDDVLAAQQETEYVNWVFYRNNPGFKIGYTWIKDGLMNKVGYVKAVRETKEPVKETYENQTEDQIAMLLGSLGDDFEGDVQVLQKDDGLFDAEVLIGTDKSDTVISNIPPEEMRISEGDTDIKSARYVSHVSKRSISEIRGLGFEIEDDVNDTGTIADLGAVRQDRHETVSENLGEEDEFEKGPSRKVTLHEEYIKIDINEDGLDELWQFIRVGDEILHKEEVDSRPYYSWSPIIVPHRHHGSTPADPVMDIQLLKSKVTRNMLDNQERLNNGRFAVVDGQVNLDDLMDGSPAGIVRQEFPGAVEALPTPALDQSAFQVLGLADSWAERRTGVSERGQGLDPRMFNSNTAATTAETVMSAAEQKLELIARIFAETGLKELMLGIHAIGLKHEHPERKIRNNNGEFIAIDPTQWRTRYDMNVTVGIGNGSKNQQMLQMQQIAQSMQSVVNAGGLGTIVTPTNVFNLVMEQTRVAGRKDGNLFFSKPESDDVDEGPSIEEQELQLEAQEQQAKLQLQAKELELKERKIALEEQQLEFEEQKHQDDNAFKVAEIELEAEQKRAVKLGS